MRRKPTAGAPVIVYSVRHVWRGMFAAEWSDRANYPRTLSELFRRVGTGAGATWTSGEEHPTGCKSGPLRAAPAEVARALTAKAEAVAATG